MHRRTESLLHHMQLADSSAKAMLQLSQKSFHRSENNTSMELGNPRTTSFNSSQSISNHQGYLLVSYMEIVWRFRIILLIGFDLMQHLHGAVAPSAPVLVIHRCGGKVPIS